MLPALLGEAKAFPQCQAALASQPGSLHAVLSAVEVWSIHSALFSSAVADISDSHVVGCVADARASQAARDAGSATFRAHVDATSTLQALSQYTGECRVHHVSFEPIPVSCLHSATASSSKQ